MSILLLSTAGLIEENTSDLLFFLFADEQMVNTPTHDPSENASENVIFTQYGKQRTNHDFNA